MAGGAAFVLGAAKSFKNWTKKAKTNQALFSGQSKWKWTVNEKCQYYNLHIDKILLVIIVEHKYFEF